MEDAITEAPRRGRPPREQTVATERRRRKPAQGQGGLVIPDAVMKRYPDMEFRYGRDEEGRIQQLTEADDWEIVPGIEPSHAGVSKANRPMKYHLLMKPKAFMEEDRAEKMEKLRQRDIGLLPTTTKEQAIATGQETYAVPGNKL